MAVRYLREIVRAMILVLALKRQPKREPPQLENLRLRDIELEKNPEIC